MKKTLRTIVLVATLAFAGLMPISAGASTVCSNGKEPPCQPVPPSVCSNGKTPPCEPPPQPPPCLDEHGKLCEPPACASAKVNAQQKEINRLRKALARERARH